MNAFGLYSVDRPVDITCNLRRGHRQPLFHRVARVVDECRDCRDDNQSERKYEPSFHSCLPLLPPNVGGNRAAVKTL